MAPFQNVNTPKSSFTWSWLTFGVTHDDIHPLSISGADGVNVVLGDAEDHPG